MMNPRPSYERRDLAVVEEWILDGLTIDGAHHKQWCLNKALRELVGHEHYLELVREEEFEEGICP